MDEVVNAIKEISMLAHASDKEIIEVLAKVVNLQVTTSEKVIRLEQDFDRALIDLKNFAKTQVRHATVQSSLTEALQEQVTALKNQLNELLTINTSKQ